VLSLTWPNPYRKKRSKQHLQVFAGCSMRVAYNGPLRTKTKLAVTSSAGPNTKLNRCVCVLSALGGSTHAVWTVPVQNDMLHNIFSGRRTEEFINVNIKAQHRPSSRRITTYRTPNATYHSHGPLQTPKFLFMPLSPFPIQLTPSRLSHAACNRL
jgi:hypothetical protein